MLSVRNRAQVGFTLIEILIALALITLLAVGISLMYDGSRSRAQVLVNTMSEMASANLRFRNDTGCYALSAEGLIDQTEAEGANSCGAASLARWNGPYINQFPVGDNGEMLLDSVAAGTLVTFSNTGGIAGPTFGGTSYVVIATGMPEEIRVAALIECNGDNATDNHDTFEGRKCASNGSDIQMIFDETR